MGTFRNKIVLIGVALLMIATLVLAILAPNVKQLMMTDEEKLTLTYPQYGDEDYATESENVKFLAYFCNTFVTYLSSRCIGSRYIGIRYT